MKVLVSSVRNGAGAVTLTGAAVADTVAGVLVIHPGGEITKAPAGSYETAVSIINQIQQLTPMKTSVSYAGAAPVYTNPDGTTGANPDPAQRDLVGCQLVVFIA